MADVLRCSFCDKTQHQVRKLVSGPSANICDECVDICVDVISDDTPPAEPPTDGTSRPTWLSAACSLCGIVAPLADALTVNRRGILCPGCVGAIEAALASRGET